MKVINNINDYAATKWLKDYEVKWLDGLVDQLAANDIEIKEILYVINGSNKAEDIPLNRVRIEGWIKSPQLKEEDYYQFYIMGRLDQLSYAHINFDQTAFIADRIEKAIEKGETDKADIICNNAKYITSKIRTVRSVVMRHAISEEGEKMMEKSGASKKAIRENTDKIRKQYGFYLDHEIATEMSYRFLVIKDHSLIKEDGHIMTIKVPNIKGEFGYPIEVLKYNTSVFEDPSVYKKNILGYDTIDLTKYPTTVVTIEALPSGLKETSRKELTGQEIVYRFNKYNEKFIERQKELARSNEFDVNKINGMGLDEFREWVQGSNDKDKGRELQKCNVAVERIYVAEVQVCI